MNVGQHFSLPQGAGRVKITSIQRFADGAVLVKGEYVQLFAGSFWDDPARMHERGFSSGAVLPDD